MVFQAQPDGYVSAAHLLPARFDGQSAKTRDDFISMMAYEHHVQVIVQYYPLYRYPLFSKKGQGKANCPETDRFFDNMVSFPFELWMSDEDVDYMIDAIRKTLNALRGEEKNGHDWQDAKVR